MSSTLYAALGTQLWISDGGSPETFFRVARVGDMTGPQSKAETIDGTTHESALQDAPYREFVTSLLDGGDVAFPIMLDPAEVSQVESATIVGTRAGGLKYLLEQRQRRNHRIVFPFTSPVARIRYVGLVTGFVPDMKVTGMFMANITIKVSGKPTLEIGTAQGA